jgi:hypothetical protein
MTSSFSQLILITRDRAPVAITNPRSIVRPRINRGAVAGKVFLRNGAVTVGQNGRVQKERAKEAHDFKSARSRKERNPIRKGGDLD